jgi:hypothetical protein
VIGDFAESLPAEQSRYVQLFYDQAREVDQAYATWNNMKTLGREDDADTYGEKNLDKLERHGSVQAATEQMSKLNLEERRIMVATDMTPKEKRESLQEIADQRHEIAKLVTLDR